jgi:hypothetical protein
VAVPAELPVAPQPLAALDQLRRWLARLVDNTRDAAGARAGVA